MSWRCGPIRWRMSARSGRSPWSSAAARWSLRSGDAGRSMTTHGQPARALGLWSCTALVVGNMVGSGVFLLPASLAPYGAMSLAGWGLTTVGSICLALVFARLAGVLPGAGGPYAYTRAAY